MADTGAPWRERPRLCACNRDVAKCRPATAVGDAAGGGCDDAGAQAGDATSDRGSDETSADATATALDTDSAQVAGSWEQRSPSTAALWGESFCKGGVAASSVPGALAPAALYATPPRPPAPGCGCVSRAWPHRRARATPPARKGRAGKCVGARPCPCVRVSEEAAQRVGGETAPPAPTMTASASSMFMPCSFSAFSIVAASFAFFFFSTRRARATLRCGGRALVAAGGARAGGCAGGGLRAQRTRPSRRQCAPPPWPASSSWSRLSSTRPWTCRRTWPAGRAARSAGGARGVPALRDTSPMQPPPREPPGKQAATAEPVCASVVAVIAIATARRRELAQAPRRARRLLRHLARAGRARRARARLCARTFVIVRRAAGLSRRKRGTGQCAAARVVRETGGPVSAVELFPRPYFFTPLVGYSSAAIPSTSLSPRPAASL
jgi:hypothetical protein